MAENYVLRITAGPDYDQSQQVEVPVNTAKPVTIKSDRADIELNVRVNDYKGLPRNSPTTSPYFSAEPHAYNRDQYSISFRFTPKKPSSDEGDGIKATDLQFGNDFDHPIRDRLPPGFNTAMSIVRWWIDPGLDGDAYADKPFLYGPALSSFNTIHVGKGEFDEEKGGLWFEEGGDEDGLEAREEVGAPLTSKARMKWALRADAKEKWVFEYDQTYGFDFFNPYLNFSDLALNLPGFQLPIMKYWDGQGLRYVLRNKETGEPYLVILFSLYHKDYVNEDGSLKEGAQDSFKQPEKATEENEEFDGDGALKEATEQLGPKIDEKGNEQTSVDDLD
ncbi:hypothetical protein FOCG_01452 [Fusarium oxysporum f. sp. radicis-lycopersici 26381]|uniref:Domain of unknown function at the cortex 1 domain-containing protein n=2 Tax=Fusarium oxysporum TaxID=5507 RepID=A0A2H3HL81_FUSOX|nr:hypothetical protein FOZG_05946 [Fusarium oxysporum Fo47]EWZ97472.1 hypothetical protein FOWG_01936 [Fusarium oxysporum f. sp. lycopersici MN25]EXL63063.1 hypothetical protein FOCG_01452 [Fusarium oxysporum f. sp. radicis-lycopersici 26381]KAH7490538.1 hypothetical protein FOMA001_g3602 [Fusarium oxysporum f. sp. matthiolae]KAK2480847.1 hypothetical protein H9L39_06486 [Fusarium oxysporum f. sp. albedinis]PCD37342.1 hypothetical protein AU210_005841 [Fusarium oxysporum f. sp. radicis-cucume